MTDGYRIIARIARLWLCVVGLLMLYALTTHKPLQSPEMLYDYFIWSLPPVLVLALPGIWARAGYLRSLPARARRTLRAWE
jgi:hypothetical protein